MFMCFYEITLNYLLTTRNYIILFKKLFSGFIDAPHTLNVLSCLMFCGYLPPLKGWVPVLKNMLKVDLSMLVYLIYSHNKRNRHMA